MTARKSLSLLLTLLMAFIFIFGAVPGVTADAASKSSLLKKIESKSGQSIYKSYYADYDGDGAKEVFAVTSDNHFYYIWFASSKQVKLVSDPWLSISGHVFTVSKKQKIFEAEVIAYTFSSMQSLCYYVENGKAKEVKQGFNDLTQISGKNFEMLVLTYDRYREGTMYHGHTLKKYYLKWTGTKFKEYTGTSITKTKLRSYKNGSNILKQIANAGYKVGKIYKRSNGIININVYKKKSGITYYDNVTLKLKNGAVSVVVCNTYGTDIVSKSSYGGIYKAKGLE